MGRQCCWPSPVIDEIHMDGDMYDIYGSSSKLVDNPTRCYRFKKNVNL
jgi:hypothetical protein